MTRLRSIHDPTRRAAAGGALQAAIARIGREAAAVPAAA
jgi:hypothetical protein